MHTAPASASDNVSVYINEMAYAVPRETRVLGVEIDGIARAYPVSVMSRHEVVNDDFGGKAYAVLW